MDEGTGATPATMDGPDAARRGFTVLDGVGLVGGAAAASVHLRDLVERPITAAGWALAWLAFSGVALSAAGPIVLGLRRVSGRARGRPRLGDGLWLLLGVPWLISAPLRPFPLEPPGRSARAGTAAGPSLYVLALGLALAACCLAAMLLVWYVWVQMPAERRQGQPRMGWTERVGLCLAIAWPLQWGFLLVVLG